MAEQIKTNRTQSQRISALRNFEKYNLVLGREVNGLNTHHKASASLSQIGTRCVQIDPQVGLVHRTKNTDRSTWTDGHLSQINIIPSQDSSKVWSPSPFWSWQQYQSLLICVLFASFLIVSNWGQWRWALAIDLGCTRSVQARLSHV